MIIIFAEQPSQRPVAKPPNHRVTPTDHLTGTGASSVFPPTLPSPPAVPENRRPTSFGTGFPPAPMQGNFNSPSQSPFGGFGLSGGWGSGVWAPNSSSASGSGGTSPGVHGLQVTFCWFCLFCCRLRDESGLRFLLAHRVRGAVNVWQVGIWAQSSYSLCVGQEMLILKWRFLSRFVNRYRRIVG